MELVVVCFQDRLMPKQLLLSCEDRTKQEKDNGDPGRSFCCASGTGLGSKVIFPSHKYKYNPAQFIC